MAKFTTSPVSNLLYDQEKIQSYCAGGYHPVRLGDRFSDGRYEIVHKLGWGGFSTVWLARDIQDEKWVGLKLYKAGSSASQREIEALKSIQAKENDASRFVVHLLDDFIHQGPNGHHVCMVTEFLGPSLSAIIADYHLGGDRLEADDILRISRQLLEATASLHETGFAHGDISGSNIVFTTSNISTLSKEDLLQIIGQPETAELLCMDGSPLSPAFPKELVRAAQWDCWTDEDEEDIRLIDMGESFRLESNLSCLAQPSELRAPETFFTGKFDYRVDLWRVGCIIYSLLFASYPFQYLGEDHVFIAQMINFNEKLPSEWQEQWQTLVTTADSKLPTLYNSTDSKLVQRVRDLVPEDELKPLLKVIQGLMRFLPKERMSARDALQILN